MLTGWRQLFAGLACWGGIDGLSCGFSGLKRAVWSLYRLYPLPCLTSINLPSGSTALARHIGAALALPCSSKGSPCRSFLSSFFCRSLTATQNTPPSRQPHLFRSQTGHTVSLLLYVTVNYYKLLYVSTYKFHCYYTLLYVSAYMFHCYTASLLHCFCKLIYTASLLLYVTISYYTLLPICLPVSVFFYMFLCVII